MSILDITKRVKPEGLEWMDDETFSQATSYMSPNEIAKVYKGYDPNDSQPFFQSLYKKTIQQPEKIDEKQVKKSRNLSALSDALGLIGQTIAGVSGGYVTPMQSAQPGNDGNINRLRELYKNRNQVYQQGLYGAATQDYIQGKANYDRNRAGLLSVLERGRALKNQKEISEARNKVDLFKYTNDLRHKESAAKETARHNKAMEGAAYMRASNSGSNKAASTNKNIVEYYDPTNNTFLQVDKNRLAGSLAQVFDALSTDKSVFPDYMDVKRQYDALSPSERINFVQQNWPKSKKARQLMYNMATSTTKGNEAQIEEESVSDNLMKLSRPAYKGPIRPEGDVKTTTPTQQEPIELPEIPEEHIKGMEQAYNAKLGDGEIQAQLGVIRYLKAQGYDSKTIRTIIKTIQDGD